MRIPNCVLATVGIVLTAAAVGGQTPPARGQTPPSAGQTPPARGQTTPSRGRSAPPRAATAAATHIIVRDVSGTPISGVNVSLPGNRRVVTGGDGGADVTLSAGSYRLRFERDGFITLEREVTIRAGQATQVEVSLSAAPPPPEPPPPPPPPPAPAPPPTRPPVASGPPVTVSIPAFLEKNFIGRDPLKESILGCTVDATTRLLQLRDPLSAHTHSDLDEILYVVAGEGGVRIGDQVTTIGPGSLSVIPRGISHAVERRGKNPLVVVSTLAGAPCAAAGKAQSTAR